MRIIATGTGERLRVTNDQRTRLKNWLVEDHKKALDGRFGIENTIRMAIRGYGGNPIDEPDQRWRPFANAPRVELTIAAEIQDTVLSQGQDLIFQVNPPLMVRSRKGDYDDAASAVQDLVDWGTASKAWNFEAGTIRGLVDQIQ